MNTMVMKMKNAEIVQGVNIGENLLKICITTLKLGYIFHVFMSTQSFGKNINGCCAPMMMWFHEEVAGADQGR